MIDLYEAGKQKHSWWQDWRGECVAIIGAGPTAKTAGVEKLQDRIHVIAINESYRLCPWAEILYSCEAEWWWQRQKEVNGFAGIRLTLDDPIYASKTQGIDKITIPKVCNNWVSDFLFDKPGVIGSGGHGGFQMINLAAQFGVTGIALIGFDMKPGGAVHWHGNHPPPLRNPDAARFWQWQQDLDRNADKLAQHGIDVINCSEISTLQKFKKLSVDEMLKRWSL